MNIYEKLLNIQNELKAPKNQKNTFGRYNYRSCEDILEAVKPLCKENKTTLTITDEIIVLGENAPTHYIENYYDKDLKKENTKNIVVGNQRFYIKATATLRDIEDEQNISVTAYARESEDKKGMDTSQITGATSSYARKYALNGLFCIDDTKDADTDEFTKNKQKEIEDKEPLKQLEEKKITPAQLKIISAKYIDENLTKLLEVNNLEKLEDMSMKKASEIISKLKGV